MLKDASELTGILGCRRRNEYGLTTYRYLYSGNFTNITPRYWLGGMHSCKFPLFCTRKGEGDLLPWMTYP